MTDWQPIETAPKDGTVVIVALENGVTLAQWVRHKAYAGCWAWMAVPWPECDFLFTVEPTHWMPLPEPPK